MRGIISIAKRDGFKQKRELKEDFNRSLRSGTRSEAESALAEFIQRRNDELGLDDALKIAVIFELNPTHRQQLGQHYPHLFSAKWIRTMRMGSGGKKRRP